MVERTTSAAPVRTGRYTALVTVQNPAARDAAVRILRALGATDVLGASTVAQARRAAAGPTPAPRPAGGGPTYAPRADGQPDPGEVVWGWVPYEDDPSRGKDRPVLLLAERDGQWLGLYLTSKDNTRDAEDEARWGRHWMDVGTGGWDSRRRPSEVRLDRLVALDRSAIRREGAALPRPMYDAVVARARALHTI